MMCVVEKKEEEEKDPKEKRASLSAEKVEEEKVEDEEDEEEEEEEEEDEEDEEDEEYHYVDSDEEEMAQLNAFRNEKKTKTTDYTNVYLLFSSLISLVCSPPARLCSSKCSELLLVSLKGAAGEGRHSSLYE